MKYGLVICLLLGIWCQLPAQWTVVESSHRPKKPTQDTWWYDPEADYSIEFFRDGAWHVLEVPVRQLPQLWHGMVLMADGEEKYVATLDGRLLLDGDKWLFAKDSVWGANDNHYGSGRIVMNYHGDTLVKYDFPKGNHPIVKPGMVSKTVTIPIQWDTIGTAIGACLPAYVPITGNSYTFELRNYGILTTQGTWLIEPKYDAPFHFENGIAEVIYYGEKRKINEKGEFVE